jgi:WS/DGAT/MGAT family acyltransferase
VYNVDAAWLHMDSPTNSVTITGLYLFDQALDFARVRATIEHRFLCFPRFVQRVREPRLPFTLPTWEPDPYFNLDTHLHRVALPAPGDWKALLALVEDLMRLPLQPDRPLWQMYYVENFGSGSALISRLSHAMADGYALMRVLKATTDRDPDTPPEAFPSEFVIEEEEESSLLVDTVVQALDRVDEAVSLSKSMLRKGLGLAAHPSRLAGVAEKGVGGALSLGKLLLIPPDRNTALRGRCTLAKRAVASDSLSLKELKEVGKVLGGTLNDVLLSAVTAGFRSYLLSKGERLEGANIRALVPVYILNGKEAPGCENPGNGFGLVYLSLPVGVEDSVERLKKVHENMQAIKHTPEAYVAYGILYGLGVIPTTVSRPIVSIFGIKGTAVMTNVPGPQEELFFSGAPIRRLMFWVPQPAGLAVGVSIISYAGQVTVGLATDAAVIPDPEIIMQAFHADYAEMRSLAAQVRE